MHKRYRAEGAGQKLEDIRDLKGRYQFLHSLINEVPDPIVVVGTDFKVKFANKAARTFSSEFVWIDGEEPFCHNLIYNSECQCSNLGRSCPLIEVVETNKSLVVEHEVEWSNGLQCSYEIHASPLWDDEGCSLGIVETLRDITERKAYQAETMRTGQLASIGELAAGVAHEVNNPINGIINFAQILLDDSEDDANSDILQRIIGEGERVAVIVSNLLAFSRQGNAGEENNIEVDVREVMNDSISLLHHQYKKDGVVFSVSGPPDLPLVWLNPQQLQQVFVNILSNGRYALNTKFAERHPDKRLEVKYGEAEVNNLHYVRICVTDFGCGIPYDILESVLNPFFTTKELGEGTGLGLSISDGIIKEFKGYLRIKSEVNNYTTVMIDLPRYDGVVEVVSD